MSKLDETKERITQLRYWIGAFLAALTALGTWLFNNIDGSKWQITVVTLLFLCSAIAILLLNRSINANIKHLGEL